MRQNLKYVIAVIAIILFIFLGYELIHLVTRPAKSNKTTSVVAPVVKPLSDYAGTNAAVRVTIEGPVIASEQRRAIQITVSRDQRTIDVMEGYRGLVLKTKSYDNDQAAYDIFLRALSGMGFTGNKKPLVSDGETLCAAGTHFYYELIDTGSDKEDFKYWSISCGLKYGSASGNGPAIRDLFSKQFPDYTDFVSDVRVQ